MSSSFVKKLDISICFVCLNEHAVLVKNRN